jgi:hypothetical protein
VTAREDRAFSDGKLAYSAGQGRSQTALRKVELRIAFGQGWDEGQRLAIASRATDEERAEGRRVLARLKEELAKL